jgi:hypothetical protein
MGDLKEIYYSRTFQKQADSLPPNGRREIERAVRALVDVINCSIGPWVSNAGEIAAVSETAQSRKFTALMPVKNAK